MINDIRICKADLVLDAVIDQMPFNLWMPDDQPTKEFKCMMPDSFESTMEKPSCNCNLHLTACNIMKRDKKGC